MVEWFEILTFCVKDLFNKVKDKNDHINTYLNFNVFKNIQKSKSLFSNVIVNFLSNSMLA